MESLTPLKQPIAIRPEHVVSSTTTIRVKQHSASWSSSNFTITAQPTPATPEPAKLFAVDGDFASWSQRRRFCDASGLPLFEISRKDLGVTYYLHLPGEGKRRQGGSTSGSGSRKEEESGRIATIVPKYSALKDKFDVHFRNAAADGEETVLEVRGQNIWKSKTHVYHRGHLVMVVRLTDMVSVYIPGKRPSWEVVVAEGMDLSLVRQTLFSYPFIYLTNACRHRFLRCFSP